MSRWARASGILLVVIGGLALFRALGNSALFPWSDDLTDAVLKLVLWIVPCTFLLWLASEKSLRGALSQLGLDGAAVRGYGFGLVASVPMLFVPLLGTPLHPVRISALVATILVGPFAEEVLFRGWMFRQLWHAAGWPPAIAIVVSAIAFGLAHPLDVTTVFTSAASFSLVISAAGTGVLLGWIVWRWNSLWPAIGLHTFMNLSWPLLGGPTLATARPLDETTAPASYARIATIVIAIFLTLLLRRRTDTKRVSG